MTVTKINHKFGQPQLSYDTPPNNQPYIKILFFCKRLPEVSYEHFHRHWETVHADLTVSSKAFGAFKIARYSQFHQTPEMKEKAKAIGPVLDWDGCSEIWVRRWEDWVNFSSSPEFAAVTAPDAKNFVGGEIAIMVGYDTLIFGDAVQSLGGKDGVLPGQLKL